MYITYDLKIKSWYALYLNVVSSLFHARKESAEQWTLVQLNPDHKYSDCVTISDIKIDVKDI